MYLYPSLTLFHLSYAEGIGVLYAMNTIHMASTVMICHLPQLLLPQRLGNITSVEMVWNFHPFRDAGPHGLPDSGLTAFYNLLDLLPGTFPHLRKLYLSLQGDMKSSLGVPTEKHFDVIESAIMKPVDDMVRRLDPRVDECDIAIPTSLYHPRKYKATGTSLKLGRKVCGEWERFWRELSPPATTGDGGGTAHLRRGYWVRLGQMDIPLSQVDALAGEVPSCFGTWVPSTNGSIAPIS